MEGGKFLGDIQRGQRGGDYKEIECRENLSRGNSLFVSNE